MMNPVSFAMIHCKNSHAIAFSEIADKIALSMYFRGITTCLDHSGFWPKVSLVFEVFKFLKKVLNRLMYLN